ncbi:hypothetical protein RIF29_47019 [Crotalaria pallida]|uniref:Uncharacterized protein n=1 Tax=Crotalaria pallida TaxID=3830 RepID=A0AAN9DNM1_CROPI
MDRIWDCPLSVIASRYCNGHDPIPIPKAQTETGKRLTRTDRRELACYRLTDLLSSLIGFPACKPSFFLTLTSKQVNYLLSSFLKNIPNSKDLMQERKKESVDSMVAERLHFHYS